MDIVELIDRVEGLTMPDRATDALVWSLCHTDGIARTAQYGSPEKAVGILYGANGHNDREPIWSLSTYRGPAYSNSLDAAMTLVPENPYNTGERFQVESWATNGVHPEHVRATAWVSGARRVYAATPALALVAAALRARLAALTPPLPLVGE